MNRRHLAPGAAAMAALLITVPLIAQSPGVTTKAVLAELAVPVKGYTQPKTQWGDPDISGVWTSDAALGIPRERPEKFGTRAHAHRRGIRRRAEGRRGAAQGAPRTPTGAFRNDGAWKTQVVPADLARHRARRRPHAGVHGRGAEARRAARSRQLRRRPVRHPARLHALRPLHHARHRRLDHAGRLRQRQPHRAGAGHGGHQLRDGARHARHLHRRPAARHAEASASSWATRAAAGKATRWSSRRRTSPTRPASAAATATACATAPT